MSQNELTPAKIAGAAPTDPSVTQIDFNIDAVAEPNDTPVIDAAAAEIVAAAEAVEGEQAGAAEAAAGEKSAAPKQPAKKR